MRLPGYDYSLPGYYFITACTKGRRELFGYIEHGRMHLHRYGLAVQRSWSDLPKHYSCVLDAFVIMPNHIHGLIAIPDEPIRLFYSSPAGAGLNPYLRRRIDEKWQFPNPAAEGLNPRLRETNYSTRQHPSTEIVRGFKTFSAAAVNRLRQTPGVAVWQRSFHEHILRTEYDVEKIREYILMNPKRWKNDDFFRSTQS